MSHPLMPKVSETSRADKIRVAWFSPLPHELNRGSVSAYVSELLLPHFQSAAPQFAQFELELFHDAFWVYQDFPTFHYLRAIERHRERPFDIFFYQLEDGGPAYHFTRSHLGLMPGIAYFHDYYFRNEGPEPFHYSPWEQIIKKCADPSLAWPERRSFPDRPEAFGRREVGLSVVPIFSNERTLTEYLRSSAPALSKNAVTNGSDVRVSGFWLPHPVRVTSERRRGTATQQVAFLGSPTFETRAHKLVGALRELPELKLLWMLDDDERPAAQELLREAPDLRVEFVGPRSPQKWSEVVTQADAAVHTLYSAFGDPHPYLAISLMAGVPSLVSNFSVPEFLPPQLLFRVQLGFGEEIEFRELLRSLCGAPGTKVFDASAYSQLARRYAEEHHDEGAVAHQLADIFRSTLKFQRQRITDWTHLTQMGQEELLRTQLTRIGPENVLARDAVTLSFREFLGKHSEI